MAETVQGYTIEIEGIDEQIEKLGSLTEAQMQLNQQFAAQKKGLKDLEDANQKGSAEYKKLTNEVGKNRAENIKLSNELRSTKRNVDLNTKSNQAAKGSYNGLVAETNKLRKQLKELPNAFDESNEAANNLKKQIADNTDQLKEFDKGIGDNFRNVGNYKDAIFEAAGASGVFGKQLGILQSIQATLAPLIKVNTKQTLAQAGAQKTANLATRTGIKVMKGFKAALAATGIGALLLALGGLVSFFTKTQRGADKVSEAMAGISAGFDVLIDRLSGTGEALSLIFSGEFSKGFDLLKEQFKGVTEEIKKEAAAARDLEKAYQELEKRRIGFIVEEARLIREIEELKTKAEAAELGNTEEAIRLNQEAIKITEELTKRRLEFAEEEARITSAQVALGESTNEDLRKEAEAIAERDRVREESAKQLASLIAKDRSLREKRNGELRTLAAEEIKILEDLSREVTEVFKKEGEEAGKEYVKAVLDEFDDLEPEDLFPEEAIDAAEDEFLSKVKESLDKEKEIRMQAAEDIKISAIAQVQEVSDLIFQAEQEAMQRRNDAATTTLERRYDTELSILQNRLDKGLIAEAEFNDQKDKLDQRQAVRERQLAKKQFQENKELMLVQAFINGRVAVGNAWATVPWPASIAAAAAAEISAAANIIAIEAKQFARGGVLPAQTGGVIEGASHADGGVPFMVGNTRMEAEGGEVIINRRSSAMFRDELSAINQAGGGIAFANGGQLPSRTGITPSRANVTVNAAESVARQVPQSQRVYVVESDITSTQNRVSVIEETGTI